MDLRQSTAVVVPFGPFVDKTDGVTLEVGLVSALDHASTGIMLSKNGGTLAVRNAAVTASEYDAHGCYKVTLDATDTGTLGTLRMIYTDPATCLAVWQDFMVLPANVWDSLYGADFLQVDAWQLKGIEQSMTDLKDFADSGYDPAAHKVAGVVLADTATNLTNAPANGDLTAAMKSSVTAAVPTTAQIKTAIEAAGSSLAQILAQIGTAGAGLTALGDTRLANLDAAISSRLAAGGYTAPDNATIAAIAGYLDTEIAAILEDTGTTLPGLLAALNNLSSAQAQAACAAALLAYGPALASVCTELRLARLDTAVSSRSSHAAADVATAVLATPANKLATDGTGRVTVATNADKSGYSLATAPPTAAEIKTAIEADGSKLDHLWETTEDDGGVRRFTQNALEQAPAGGEGGGDATAENQTTIITHLEDIKGTGFVKDTNSLVNVSGSAPINVTVEAAITRTQ